MTILLIVALILTILAFFPQVASYPLLNVALLLVILALLVPRLNLG